MQSTICSQLSSLPSPPTRGNYWSSHLFHHRNSVCKIQFLCAFNKYYLLSPFCFHTGFYLVYLFSVCHRLLRLYLHLCVLPLILPSHVFSLCSLLLAHCSTIAIPFRTAAHICDCIHPPPLLSYWLLQILYPMIAPAFLLPFPAPLLFFIVFSWSISMIENRVHAVLTLGWKMV